MDLRDDPVAWVAALPVADPVQHRVLEGLARRAAAQPAGSLRERLLARLVQRAQGTQQASPPPAAPRPASAPSPLAALLTRLVAAHAAGPGLRQVQAHDRTWQALRVARRMAEVSAPVPEHLGPLNNQVLASRALQQLQGLSPGYLQRLLTQLDTLAALAPVQAAEPPADKPGRAPRVAIRKAPTRRR
ncbi:MAG: DUF2894 domain-containing protein [Burkholderiales bacterium]|uniref:DUF2894 domain-containing protein n=1 Tax=Roseateles sp. TaxID=1971397 RepID=UPI000FC3AABC|nr:MAG: DUF2894 domain-containing protein [Burkholderiales bacterium]